MVALKLWPLMAVIIWQLFTYAAGRFDTSNQWFGVNYQPSVFTDNAIATKPDIMKILLNDLNNSIAFVEKHDQLSSYEKIIQSAEIKVSRGTPEFGQLIDSRTDDDSLTHGRYAQFLAKVSINLYGKCFRLGVSLNDCVTQMRQVTVDHTPLKHVCAVNKPKACDGDQPYRTSHGGCNNPKKMSQGKAFSAYKRLLPPVYLGGLHLERRAVSKAELPNARAVSHVLSPDFGPYDTHKTLAFAYWGQFIEHDLTHTGFRRMITDGQPIQCCGADGFVLAPRHTHPYCMSVNVGTDPIYHENFYFCMNYVRSQLAVRDDCSLGPIDQMNQASHFLDASHIYGSTEKQARSLRTGIGGRLVTAKHTGENFPAPSSRPDDDCQFVEDDKEKVCFRGGDSRVNQHPPLTALYTLFVREHNRLADTLIRLNPQWNDEKLYQEARRIIIAMVQHVTYEHWKPLLLGNARLEYQRTVEDFTDNVDPTVSNSFATAAIRFLTSLINGKINLLDEDRNMVKSLNLSDHYNNPKVITKPDVLDRIVRGLASQKCNKLDLGVTAELTNKLFIDDDSPLGYDVLTLDIQRGRDHGLPPYNQFRELCGYTPAQTFSDFGDTMHFQNIKSLQKVYQHPDDVDLLVGLLAERPKDSFVGPTLSCLISDQLTRTKRGDRFFYTHKNQPKPFTDQQLAELKKVSLARVICDNTWSIQKIQPNVFEKISERNPLVKCDAIPAMNLNAWREMTSVDYRV